MIQITSVCLEGNFVSGYYFAAKDHNGDLWHSKTSGNYATMTSYLKILKKKSEINPDRWIRVHRYGVPTNCVTGNQTDWAEDQAEPPKFGSQRNTGMSWRTQGANLNVNLQEFAKENSVRPPKPIR